MTCGREGLPFGFALIFHLTSLGGCPNGAAAAPYLDERGKFPHVHVQPGNEKGGGGGGTLPVRINDAILCAGMCQDLRRGDPPPVVPVVAASCPPRRVPAARPAPHRQPVWPPPLRASRRRALRWGRVLTKFRILVADKEGELLSKLRRGIRRFHPTPLSAASAEVYTPQGRAEGLKGRGLEFWARGPARPGEVVRSSTDRGATLGASVRGGRRHRTEQSCRGRRLPRDTAGWPTVRRGEHRVTLLEIRANAPLHRACTKYCSLLVSPQAY